MDYPLGTLVMAKVRGYPYWPGVVVNPSGALCKQSGYTKENFRAIYFFGSHNYGWVKIDNMIPYSKTATKVLKRKSLLFVKACDEIEKFLKNAEEDAMRASTVDDAHEASIIDDVKVPPKKRHVCFDEDKYDAEETSSSDESY